MTDEIEAPDAFDPRAECGAWRKQPGVIGAPQHTHVCRREAASAHQPYTYVDAGHLCGCGHIW